MFLKQIFNKNNLKIYFFNIFDIILKTLNILIKKQIKKFNDFLINKYNK